MAGGARTILVVEDNADAREALRVLLELEGHLVEAVADGGQAVDYARAKDPDVALVDIGLPGLDGFEVARRIRSVRARRPVLIALTGYGQPEDRQRATEAGFDSLLVKPVDPAILADLLVKLEIPPRESRG